VAFMQVLARKQSKEIHALVNSQYGDSLLVGLISAKALQVSSPCPENKTLLDIAQYKYDEHIRKQARVDQMNQMKVDLMK